MARITVLNLMAFVVIVALGLAAMRDATLWALRIVYAVTFIVLMAALVGAIVTKGNAGTAGFAVFSWGYTATWLVFATNGESAPELITAPLVNAIVDRLLEIPPEPSLSALSLPGLGSGNEPATAAENARYKAAVTALNANQSRLMSLGRRVEDSNRIAHCMLALLLGLFGAGVGRFLAAWPKRPAALPVLGNGEKQEKPDTNP